MCDRCSQDPRDAIGEAERALLGLRFLLNGLPPRSEVSVEDVAAIIDLIHDRLDGAAAAINGYVPRAEPLPV